MWCYWLRWRNKENFGNFKTDDAARAIIIHTRRCRCDTRKFLCCLQDTRLGRCHVNPIYKILLDLWCRVWFNAVSTRNDWKFLERMNRSFIEQTTGLRDEQIRHIFYTTSVHAGFCSGPHLLRLVCVCEHVAGISALSPRYTHTHTRRNMEEANKIPIRNGFYVMKSN